MPRYIAAPTMTPNQALYVLESALAEKKITKADIRRYLSKLATEIRDLEQRISILRSHSVGTSQTFEKDGAFETRTDSRTRTRRLPLEKTKSPKRVSPERRASMKLQGQYLALIAKVAKKDRAKFKKLAKTEGREKAIAAMRKTV